jgi:peroxiredoxin Q/BCP
VAADVGQPAPDFSLPATTGGEVKLSDLTKQGKNVVVFFFPKAFTGTCERQVAGHAADYDKFKALNAEVVGISTDQTPSQQAFAKQCGQVSFPLLSDNRFRAVMDWGVGKAEGGLPNDRAGFVVDKQGVVRYKHIEPKPGEWSGTAGALEALQKIEGK